MLVLAKHFFAWGRSQIRPWTSGSSGGPRSCRAWPGKFASARIWGGPHYPLDGGGRGCSSVADQGIPPLWTSLGAALELPSC